jgi:hypothetical protein
MSSRQSGEWFGVSIPHGQPELRRRAKVAVLDNAARAGGVDETAAVCSTQVLPRLNTN